MGKPRCSYSQTMAIAISKQAEPDMPNADLYHEHIMSNGILKAAPKIRRSQRLDNATT